MVGKKITPQKLADMVILRGIGYSNSEIAEKMEVSVSTIEYHFRELKKRAEETTPYQVALEVLMSAGPLYALKITPLRMTPDELVNKFVNELKGGEE